MKLKKVTMNIKKPRISLIGCGWLGKPLCKTLDENYQVSCYTRRQEEIHLDHYYYNPPKESLFWDCDYLIVAISTKDNYLETLKQIALNADANTVLILMSSISVYKEYDCEIDEGNPITQSSKQYEAEQLLQELRDKLIILRLGGLMGDDRIAGKWSKVSLFADGFVNYVHRDDVIGVVEAVLSQKIEHGIFNVVAPKHPLRSAVHNSNAQKFGFRLGEFKEMCYRKVFSTVLERDIKYNFRYPDPLKFW
ncbi:MAG: NAD(P)-binding domain-containing protein [Thiovulaceae bacterium]|nr:NAD(P)-binding domain-containing protein [Sulfurimonadaceae bacterium]